MAHLGAAAQSWVAPHRVRRNNQFYGRNSAGRYALDVGELRTAFTLTEGVAERIRAFRAERLAKLYGRETPVPIHDGGTTVLHIVPLAAFTERPTIDLLPYYNREQTIRPMGASGWAGQINLDGFVSYTDGGEVGSRAYTQLFRSGIVEGVAAVLTHEGGMFLPSVAYEQRLIEALRQYAAVPFGLGLEPPLFVFLSFVGVRGCTLALGHNTNGHWY